MTAKVVVMGLGSPYRRDDGVGPVVAAAVQRRDVDGVRVLTGMADPVALLDAWADVPLAVVVDAAVGPASPPGRVLRCTPGQLDRAGRFCSHGLDVANVLALGRELGRVPLRLSVIAVGVADTRPGVGLTSAVAAAVPIAVAAVLAELSPPSVAVSRD
jgi:hydrogenase maturation protease